MKTTLILLVFIIALSCSDSKSNLEKEANVYMNGAKLEADNWFAKLDKHGYSLYLNQHFPPRFEKAIFKSMDSTKKEQEINKWIHQVDQEFGTVKERKLIGVHIITKGKLLTHLVNGPQGFSYTSPKQLGFNKVSQMYLKNIKGTYAYFMYESKPTKKDRAEELIVLWLDENNKWNFITYKIDDNI